MASLFFVRTVARLALQALAAHGIPRAAPPAEPPHEAAPPSATVVFGGDIIPHGTVLDTFDAHGPAAMLAPLAPVFAAADVALVNLETPASPSRVVPRAGMRFNVHPEFVRALADAGIDGASVANNHSYDQGVDAVGETVATLRAAGLRAAGGALPGEDPLAPQRFPLPSVPGGELCLIAATRLHNYSVVLRGAAGPRVASAVPTSPPEQDALLAAVRRARPRCPALVVSLHTGLEYLDAPLERDREFFHRVAAAGADVVVGHHSHTAQPVELFETEGRRVPIFYSLGNLLSGQAVAADAQFDPSRWHNAIHLFDPRLREGLLAVLRFEPDGAGRLRVAQFGYVPLWTVNTTLRHAPGEAATVAASLMPREGGDDAMLRRYWQRVVQLAGEQFLLPEAALPAAARAYEGSDRLVEDSRRGFLTGPPVAPPRPPPSPQTAARGATARR